MIFFLQKFVYSVVFLFFFFFLSFSLFYISDENSVLLVLDSSSVKLYLNVIQAKHKRLVCYFLIISIQ